MTTLSIVKEKLPQTLILEFLNANDDCTIDLLMLVELGVYITKDTAVEVLRREPFEEGLDYSVLKLKSTKTGSSAIEANDYLLTSDCFKAMCLLAETSAGKLVWRYYLEVEKRWKAEQRKKSEIEVATVSPTEAKLTESINNLVDELLDFVIQVCWESQDRINKIQAETLEEPKKLKTAFLKGIDRKHLYSLAKQAIGRIGHNTMHQHQGIAKIAVERAEPYREQMMVKLKSLQYQILALPTQTKGVVEVRTVILRPRDNRKRIEEFLDELESTSPPERLALLNTLPLSEQEQRHGRWSSRLVARYLGLAPHQHRTVLNIMQKRGWSL